MLDKTPVLDIKPYIPQYDDPSEQELEINRDLLGVKNMAVPPGSPGIYPGNREDPDGEESDEEQVMKSLVHPLPQVCILLFLYILVKEELLTPLSIENYNLFEELNFYFESLCLIFIYCGFFFCKES